MKNEKYCFNKSVGVIALVLVALAVFAAAASQFTNQPTSTNTRAAGVNPIISEAPQQPRMPNWIGLRTYFLFLSGSEVKKNSMTNTINDVYVTVDGKSFLPKKDTYKYTNLNQFTFLKGSETNQSLVSNLEKKGLFILDSDTLDKFLSDEVKYNKSVNTVGANKAIDQPLFKPCYSKYDASNNSAYISPEEFFKNSSTCQGKKLTIYQNIVKKGIYLVRARYEGNAQSYLVMLNNDDDNLKNGNPNFITKSIFIPYMKEVIIESNKDDVGLDYKGFSNKDIMILPTSTPERRSVRQNYEK